MGPIFWLTPNFQVFAWRKHRKLQNLWKMGLKILNNGYPFLLKWPLKMSRGLRLEQYTPVQTKSESPPPPPNLIWITIVWLPSTTEWLFGFNAPGHCLVRVRLLHCMRVLLRNGYTRAYAQRMQHTHTHKAVTGRVETKKLLSFRRQSNYRPFL